MKSIMCGASDRKFSCDIIIVTTISLLAMSSFLICDSQIVSHELRKLAVSANQFGLDLLRALDKLEPPDKVIVFCPVCVSSSLMMIMMGSSKYQVVASLRHALYVWSMKPQDINAGFRDIFDHIGLNQQQLKNQIPSSNELILKNHESRGLEPENYDSAEDLDGFQSERISRRQSRFQLETPIRDSVYDLMSDTNSRYLSLPKLMRMKEYLDRSSHKNLNSWWQNIDKKVNETSKGFKKTQDTTSNVKSNIEMDGIVEDKKNNKIKYHLGDSSLMNAISNIYVQRGLNMNYNYHLMLRRYYKTVIHPVDFVRNAEETRQHINSLVASNTEGKIKDLVGKNSFDNATSNPKIMIISTFHFRGTLDVQMKVNDQGDIQPSNKTKSRRDDRASSDSKIPEKEIVRSQSIKSASFIKTEEALLKYGLFKDPDCTVVEIPFINRLVSLIIVMPNHLNSTDLLLTKLSAQVLSDLINMLTVRKVSIEIPVIKFDRGPMNVEGALNELGLDNIFFKGKISTSETGMNKWMRPSDIVHETSIDIGTINPRWNQPEDRLKVGAHEGRTNKKRSDGNNVKLDKPFFYFVFDSINGLVLTMGRIRQ